MGNDNNSSSSTNTTTGSNNTRSRNSNNSNSNSNSNNNNNNRFVDKMMNLEGNETPTPKHTEHKPTPVPIKNDIDDSNAAWNQLVQYRKTRDFNKLLQKKIIGTI